MFRKKKKNTVGRIIPPFFCKSSESGRFSIIYMIRIRFFGPGELNQQGFRAAQYPVTLPWSAARGPTLLVRAPSRKKFHPSSALHRRYNSPPRRLTTSASELVNFLSPTARWATLSAIIRSCTSCQCCCGSGRHGDGIKRAFWPTASRDARTKWPTASNFTFHCLCTMFALVLGECSARMDRVNMFHFLCVNVERFARFEVGMLGCALRSARRLHCCTCRAFITTSQLAMFRLEVVFFFFVCAVSMEAADAKSAGNAAYASGDLETAATRYMQALQLWENALPTAPRVLAKGTFVRYRKERFGVVSNVFPVMEEYFLKDRETNQPVWVLGQVGVALERFSRDDLQVVTQELIDVRLACAQNLAAVHLKWEDYAGAVRWANAALALDGRSTKAILRKGSALLRSGRAVAALQTLNTAENLLDKEIKTLIREVARRNKRVSSLSTTCAFCTAR